MAEEQPALAISDAEVERGLAAYAHAQQEISQQACGEFIALGVSTLTLDEAKTRVIACYRQGAREAADALISTRPEFFTWDQAEAVVDVSCRFQRIGSDGWLEVTARRLPGVAGPLAIAIPPGTYGVPFVGPSLVSEDDRWTRPEDHKRFGHWPKAQDLALLRAPVLSLAATDSAGSVRSPVACASFRIGPPLHNQPFSLGRFEPGSAVDRVVQALCSGRPSSASVAQMAVWLSRENIGWPEYAAAGGNRWRLVTFQGQTPIQTRDAQQASRTLLKAGVDPRPLRFFQRNPQPVTEPSPRLASPSAAF